MDDQRDLERMLGNLRQFQSESDASKESEKSPSNAGTSFDADEFLAGLDAMFASHTAKDKADEICSRRWPTPSNGAGLCGSAHRAQRDDGIYRSQGRHQENQWIIQRAIELALRMGLKAPRPDHHADQRGHIATGRRQSRPGRGSVRTGTRRGTPHLRAGRSPSCRPPQQPVDAVQPDAPQAAGNR